MRKTSLILIAALLLALFCGCPKPAELPTDSASPVTAPTADPVPAETETIPQTGPAAETDPVPETEPVTEPVPETEPVTEPEPEQPKLSWQKAFRSSDLPEGWVAEDCIAFYQVDREGAVSIHNVPKEEVYAFRPERLPRTHYFDQFLSEQLRTELLPVLDYALAHCYCRCSIPTTSLRRGDLSAANEFLSRIYQINSGGVGSLDIQSFPLENGESLNFLLVTLPGMDSRGMMPKFLDAMAAAEEIVDSMPEGLNEFQTALWLYRYLTDNVAYYDGDYYGDGGRNFLYDALVRHNTVCAGYTEALYYLYNMAGIECFTISGYISSLGYGDDIGGGHIWNVAVIDGQFYQFDSTWDEGLSVADYSYFGVSDSYMLAEHTDYVTQWDQEHMPECPENLLPAIDPTIKDTDEGRQIRWYYRLRNALLSDPARIGAYYGVDISLTEETDGRRKANLDEADWVDLFSYIMHPDEGTRLIERYGTVSGGSVYFPAKDENAVCFRLCSLTKESDQVWLASGYLLSPDGTMEAHEERVTMTYNNDHPFVLSVEISEPAQAREFTDEDFNLYLYGSGEQDPDRINICFYPDNLGSDGQPDPNIRVWDSYLITEEAEIRDICGRILASEYYDPDRYGRTLESMVVEWKAHNAVNNAYDNERTRHVDFNRADEGVTYVEFWQRAVREFTGVDN